MTNWSAIAALCSMLTILATLLGMGFTYGKLTEKIAVNTDKTRDHDLILGIHTSKLGEHDVALGIHATRINEQSATLSRLSEWKDGYNAAARLGGTQQRS